MKVRWRKLCINLFKNFLKGKDELMGSISLNLRYCVRKCKEWKNVRKKEKE